jgi:hypothetical protein
MHDIKSSYGYNQSDRGFAPGHCDQIEQIRDQEKTYHTIETSRLNI